MIKYHSEKEIKKNKGIKGFYHRNGNAYGVCEGLIVQDMQWYETFDLVQADKS